MTHATKLRKAIAASGLTVAEFAARILGRSKSSVHRWLNGEHAIPKAVLARLDAYLTSTTE